MEALLNLNRHQKRQNLYLRAINLKLSNEIIRRCTLMRIPNVDGIEWDVPGHVGDGMHFAMVLDVPEFPEHALLLGRIMDAEPQRNLVDEN